MLNALENIRQARETLNGAIAGLFVLGVNDITTLLDNTRAEIDEGWPGFLESGRRPEGYEPDDSVLARVLTALEAIAKAHDGDVLVVTHGGVVRVVERHFGGDAAGLIPNLGGLWLDHDDKGLKLGDRVVLLDESLVTRPQQL